MSREDEHVKPTNLCQTSECNVIPEVHPVVNRHRRKMYDEEKIREFYLSKPMSVRELSLEFHLSIPTVTKVINGLPLYTRTQINNPFLNENYFASIDTEVKAYFIGLIIADGNVFRFDTDKYKKTDRLNRGLVSITLSDNDAYLLESFRKEVNASRKVTCDGRGASTMSVSSSKMASDLENLGITPRKSFTTRFPFEIDQKLYRHVIRGIFDGDGSIRAEHKMQADGRVRFMHLMTICGSHRLMEEINSILVKCNIVKRTSKVYDYHNRVLSEFKYANVVDMYRFGTWLYEDASIFLSRKREKFDAFKEHYKITDGSTYEFQSRTFTFPIDGFNDYNS